MGRLMCLRTRNYFTNNVRPAARGDGRHDRPFSDLDIDPRFLPRFRLARPDSDLFAYFLGQLRESQASVFPRLIDPCQFPHGTYPGRRIHRKAEMNWATGFHWSDSLKAQSASGKVSNKPAIIKWQAQVSEKFSGFSFCHSAFLWMHGPRLPEIGRAIQVPDWPRVQEVLRACVATAKIL